MKPIETLAGNLEQASVIQKKTEYKGTRAVHECDKDTA